MKTYFIYNFNFTFINQKKLLTLFCLRDVKWESGDCLLTWSSIGVWQVGANYVKNAFLKLSINY